MDLVQFPQPVYITDVRIIPLGARVQADFPGGVRLGATNPSKFRIQLFVNDLAKPGASAFESLGDFEYNQNDCINLQCSKNGERTTNTRQIPTDGLVLRGWYTTITLAVYGLLAKDEISERQISSPTPPIVPIEDLSIARTNDDLKGETAVAIGGAAIAFSNTVVKAEATKDIPSNYFSGDTNSESIIPLSKANVSDSARQYTEEWVASTGKSVVLVSAVTEANVIEAKSPDIDNWDGDDDLSKTISSPRSRSPDGRKGKRELSPEYTRRHRGVLDKKISKTKEYEASRRSPPLNRTGRSSPDDLPSLSGGESRRPRTPDSRLSDDFNSFVKTVQSPQSVTEDNLNSTAVTSIGANEPDDDMSQGKRKIDFFSFKHLMDLFQFAISGEPFEPILSDDEIGDDAIDQYEIEYEDTELAPFYSALKHFNPFTEDVKQYVVFDEKVNANANIKELIELATKCLHRSKLKESACIEKTFIESQSNEMRENWVQAAEQLIQIINLIYNLAGSSYSRSQKALNNLIILNRQHLIDWMRIALNFDCANAQQQPGFKIRHMKCGLRLIEMLAVDETFVDCLVYKEKFNVFDYLFRLYEQKFMALSLKLMICRAIFACLDTKTGIEFFTRTDNNDGIKTLNSEINGYQKLIRLLQENPLTRIKFALKSILKKVHLYESLQVIKDIVNRQFVNGDVVKMEFSFDDMDVASDEKLLQNCLKEIWSAFTWDAQSYSQPRRFLPILTKFEKVIDLNATKMAGNSFIRYFRINGLLESLLVILSHSTNHHVVSEDVFDLTLLLIESLCRSEFGLNYLCEKIDVTNILIKCLIQATVESTNIDDVDMTENDSNANATLDDAAENDEESRRYQLGIEVAYKVRMTQCFSFFFRRRHFPVVESHFEFNSSN